MTLEPHELSKLFPPISEEDFDKLAADIRLHGLHQPIVRYQGKILDGNNRYRACELAKIAPKFADFIPRHPNEAGADIIPPLLLKCVPIQRSAVICASATKPQPQSGQPGRKRQRCPRL